MPSTEQKKWQLRKRKYLEKVVSTKKINRQENQLSEKGTVSTESYKTQAALEKKRAAARVYSKRAYHADPQKRKQLLSKHIMLTLKRGGILQASVRC